MFALQAAVMMPFSKAVQGCNVLWLRFQLKNLTGAHAISS